MTAQAIERPSWGGRVAALLLVLGLLLANSLLFYFVIWDLLSPSQPYTVILFFLSGAGQLGYFFLPWFAREILAPLFRASSEAGRRFRDGGHAARADGFVITVFTHIGAALCLSAIGLWFLQTELMPAEEPAPAYISEANCTQIGGKPVWTDGKLVCALEPESRKTGSNLERRPAGAKAG